MSFFFPNTPRAPVRSIASHGAARVTGLVTNDDVTMKVNQCKILRNPSEGIQLKALGLSQCVVILGAVVNRTPMGNKELQDEKDLHRCTISEHVAFLKTMPQCRVVLNRHLKSYSAATLMLSYSFQLLAHF